VTRVKICGITSAEDLAVAVAAGADAVGFVVDYPDPVPWNLDAAEAETLLDRVGPFVSTVVVTTGSVERVTDLVRRLRPNAVQLHGDEDPGTVASVASALGPEGVTTLKAVPVDPADAFEDQVDTVREFEACGVDGVVLDAKADDRRGGGTGRTVPWDRARRIAADASVPVVLAGGLTPDNVRTAAETVRPAAVDVISGVERERGVKGSDRVAAFVKAAHGTRMRSGAE
jgi:phosphoribosylanthranilate isomerase